MGDVCKNVFEAILKYGHDEDFVPYEGDEFSATDAPAGSRAKIDILADRVLQGMPLWHPEDRNDYSGLTGVVRPRDEDCRRRLEFSLWPHPGSAKHFSRHPGTDGDGFYRAIGLRQDHFSAHA